MKESVYLVKVTLHISLREEILAISELRQLKGVCLIQLQPSPLQNLIIMINIGIKGRSNLSS